MEKTAQMLLLEARDPEGRDIKEILADAYRKGGSTFRAGALLGISPGTFWNWVTLLGGSIESEVRFREGVTA